MWIERAALEPHFEDGVSVVSVVAGPGYGKTVLAGQFAERWTGTALWYGLDQSDGDLSVFAAHLDAMLRTGSGDANAEPRAQPSSAREIGRYFAEALLDVDRPLVVFDDVHVLEDARALAALGEFVERGVRAGARFVLCGRAMPVPLHQHAASGRLATFGPGDLAFDEDQSTRYLERARVDRRDAGAVASLARSAEGWPAGLALIASAPVVAESIPFALAESGDETRRFLFDYLAAEVLSALAEPERRFLLQTSILEELESATCDALVGTTDGAAYLASFARRGLFVTRRAEGAYTAHQLFRAFLRHELARTYDAAAISALHARAADEALRRGDAPGAIAHLLESGDAERAADVFETNVFAMLSTGMLARAGAFFARFDDARIAASATLLTARGRLQQLRGDWGAAFGTLEHAIAAARASGETDVLAEAVRVLSPILASRGQSDRLRTLLEDTLAEPLSDIGRATLSLTLGAVHLEAGRTDDALDLFALALPLVVARGDLGLQGMVLHNRGVAHLRRGDPLAALATYERALAVKRRARQRVSALLTLGNLVVVHRILGELEAAERIVREMLAEARDIGNATMLAHALENLGAIELELGNVDRAEAALVDSRAACDPSDVLFLPDIVHGLARVAFARGALDLADARAVEALAILRVAERREPMAPVIATRAAIAFAAGDPIRARAFADEALAASATGADDLIAATVAIDVAVLHARLGDRERSAHVVADARARIVAREYAFLYRTKAAAFAELGAETHASAEEAAPLAIALFGGFSIRVRGEALAADAWKRRKARDIFAYLACERGRAVPRARLIDLFWPDVEADAAHDNLRVTISAIRKAVGDVVKFEASAYRFVPPAGTTSDVVTVDEAHARARAALATGHAEASRRAYATIVRAYAGDLLEGVAEPWAIRERERFRGIALEALRAVLASETDPAERRTLVDRILEIAPFDEAVLRERLEALAADARLPDARRAYASWRARYRETLGAEAPDVWSPERATPVG